MRKFISFLLRFLPLLLALFPYATPVKAATTNAIVFSYGYDYVWQTIDISSFAGSMTTVSATVSAKQVENGPDRIAVKLLFRNGEGQQVHSLNDPVQYETAPVEWGDITFVADLSAFDTSSWTEMVVQIWGKDAENWGGNYGTAVQNISLSIDETDQTSLLTNPDFSSVTDNAPDGWSSNQGWDTCQGLSTATLCVGNLAAPNPVPETTTTTSTTTTVPPTTTTTLPPTQSGLEYWTFQSSGGSPPEPQDTSTALSSGTVNSISYQWGSGQILDSGRSDGVLIWFQGFIQPPDAGTYDFYLCSDDGMRLYLDDVLVLDNWYDRGTSCGQSYSADFTDGQAKALKVSWYENGGGASVYLRYMASSLVDVPASWYSYGGQPTPTPTTTTTTTVPKYLGQPKYVLVTPEETGVRIAWKAATDDTGVSPERYAISWSTGQSGWGVATGNVGDESALNTEILLGYSLFESTGGLDAEYSFTVRADNDTNAVYSQPSAPVVLAVSTPTTTTTTPPTTTTTPTTTTVPPTTTTTVPPTTTTQAPPPPPAPPPVTSAAPTTAPPTTAPPTTAPPTTAPPTTAPETTAPATTAPETTPAPTTAPTTVATTVATTTPTTVATTVATTVPTTTPTTVATTVAPATTVPPPTTIPQPETESIEEIIQLSSEELDNFISSVVVSELNTESISAVFSEEVLTELNDEQVVELISEINEEELTEEQAYVLSEALSEAPENVKAEFQDEVNIFSGTFDNYVPIGSSISVEERRVVIAAGAVIAVASAPAGGSRRKLK